MEFTHLHVNTEYSLLKGAAKIDSLVNRAKELQFTSLAITDQNVMYGVIPFYKACVKAGIKPIIGLELSVASDNHVETKMILLAKSEKGYKNLLKLSSIAQVVLKTNVKMVEKKHLFSYSQDLIAISSAYKGEIQLLISEGNYEQVSKKIEEYKQYFGEDYYVGIQDHLLAEEKQINLHLVKLSKKGNIKLVATNQVMYVTKEDSFAHKCLLAIDQGTTLRELKSEFPSEEYYLKSKSEMEKLFAAVPEALTNCEKITELCQLQLDFGGQALPKYPISDDENAKDYLYKLCFQGLKKRYSTISKELEERLTYELSIIDEMQFNDYFLIVWDFMKFAHEREIITGPGRGSAAGSLVAYVLKITDVDPIKYELLFERFLNPERVTMPDIDIDFPDTRREEVINYVHQKYGKNHVAQIITFGTLAAKAALRDIGKVIGIPLKQIDSIAKLVPSRPSITIEDAVKETPLLQKQLAENEKINEWFALAKRVEGIPRHASTHAAGIVISEVPLTEKVPLQKGHNDVLLTQYSMNILEELGLLKMDFLGLRNLSFMEEIIDHVMKLEGKKIDLSKIPFNDKETFKLLGKGDTAGIFQLESPGMRRVLSNLKPSEFEDIVAVNALYRPGPMENIPLYISGKHNKRQVSYLHNDLKPILEKTYGVIVYQEQIMQIASKMAGFSLGEADILRRAVSKKKLETLEEQREGFVQGCISRGYGENVARDVYDLIVRFANYGFNRSHSVAYSVISYQLAYLKANYPTAFFASLLTSAIGQQTKVNQYILDAKSKDIVISLPSINKSYDGFTITDKKQIQFGLAAVKNVGIRAIGEIIKERLTNGNFLDIFDFCSRISSKLITRRTIESLIMAGCFDELGHHRAGLLATLDYAIEYGEQMKSINDDGQTALFMEDIKKPDLVQVPPFKEAEKLYFEKQVLGFYLSNHPIEAYLSVLEAYCRSQISKAIVTVENQTRLAGLIESVKIIKTKKGEQMAFVKLSDESGEMDVTVFPRVYRDYYSTVKVGQLVLFEGKLETIEEKSQFIVYKAYDVKGLPPKTLKSESVLFLKINQDYETQMKLKNLKETLKKFPGNVKVILHYEDKKQNIQLSDDFNITASNQCLEALFLMLGRQNVVLK